MCVTGMIHVFIPGEVWRHFAGLWSEQELDSGGVGLGGGVSEGNITISSCSGEGSICATSSPAAAPGGPW